MNVIERTRLRVAMAITMPFVMYNRTNDSFYGYCIDLLSAITDISDLDFDLKLSSDGHFGDINKSGHWDGVIKDLITDKADVGVGALWVTHHRMKVVDYTIPYYKDNGFTIMMRRDNKTIPFLWFITILDHHVWLNFIVAFLVTSILIYLFERYSPLSYTNAPERYRDEPDPRFASLRGCLWFCAMSLTPNGGGATPKNLSGKLAAVIWWTFGLIIVAAYSANLAAYRTLDRLERHIQTIDDLRRQYQVDYSTVIDSPTYRHFESLKANEKVLSKIWREMSLNYSLPDWEKHKLIVWEYPVEEKYTKIYNEMEKTGFLADVQEAINNVRKINRTREFAYIGQTTLIRYLTMTNCDLREVGDEFGKRPYAFAVQKDSPYRRKLDKALTRVMIQGVLLKLEKKWWDENPLKARCLDNDKTDGGFTLRETAAVFALVITGILFVSLILCLQYVWCIIRKEYNGRRIQRKRNKNGKNCWR